MNIEEQSDNASLHFDTVFQSVGLILNTGTNTRYGSPSITMMTLLQIERKDNYWGVLRRCIAKWLCRPMRDPQILPQERQGYVALEGVGTAAR